MEKNERNQKGNVDENYLLGTLIDIEIDNLIHCKNAIDLEKVDRLIQDIQDAPQIVIIGSRASSVLVSYATYIFNKIGIRTLGFDTADTKSIDTIINFDRTTLVIAIGFARYPRSTIVAARFLKTRGYKVVSVTDNKKSPLEELSAYSFKLKADSYGFVDSYSSAMTLINLLATIISKISSDDVSKRLKDFNETAQQLDFYL